MLDSHKRPYSHPNGLTLIQQMISSCTGGLITSLFMTPFDVVKVRLQTQQRETLKSKCFVYCNGLMDHICNCTSTSNGKFWYNRPVPVYLNGTTDAFIKITRSEGINSLWSGLPPTLIVALPNTIVYLTTYEHILKTIKSYGSDKFDSFYAGGLAGGLARGCSVTVVSPFELLRTKIQSKNTSYREVLNTLKNDFLITGPTSLWKGWGATMMRDVPFSIIYWGMYEYFKQKFGQQHPSVSFAIAAGAVSGGASALATLPFDVVKTHQQIEIEKKLKKVDSTLIILKNIYSQQGIRGLFTGFVPRLAKVMPACAIMLSSYEYAKAYFRRKNSSVL